MDNTIGKCECIYTSDKFDIDRLIVKNIDKLDDQLTRLRLDRKELIEFGANVDELSKRYESQKLALKRLLLRVRNTPDCK